MKTKLFAALTIVGASLTGLATSPAQADCVDEATSSSYVCLNEHTTESTPYYEFEGYTLVEARIAGVEVVRASETDGTVRGQESRSWMVGSSDVGVGVYQMEYDVRSIHVCSMLVCAYQESSGADCHFGLSAAAAGDVTLAACPDGTEIGFMSLPRLPL